MDKDRNLEPVGLLKEVLELGRAERFAIDVRSELDAAQAAGLDASQFLGRQVRVLQGHKAKPEKLRWVLVAGFGDELVSEMADVYTVLRFKPIGSQFRQRRNNLGVHPLCGHCFQSFVKVPVRCIGGAEVFAGDHHLCLPRLKVVHGRPTFVAANGRRKILGNDVGVHVDLHFSGLLGPD